jgi:hypothetical protein
MTTVTLRVPESMAERLTSVQMRSWIVDFLHRPHSLPPDPGSGEQRVSLTLSREEVLQVAGSLRCSPSVALRRVAAERLGISSGVALSVPARAQEATSGTIPNWPPLLYSQFTTGMPPTNTTQPRKRAVSGIEVLFSVLPGMVFLGCLVFAVTRGAKPATGT